MNAELLPLVLSNVSKHEGRVRQMYLDTKGFVTCGVGHAIFKSEDAVCFDWYRIDRKASRGEIVDDYAAVKHGARKRGYLFLPEEEIDRLLAYDLGRFYAELEQTFPELHAMPQGAQVALLDIAFQTGSVSPKRWPKLTAAVKAGDWMTASGECVRPAAGLDRNVDTAQQFLSCLVLAEPETEAA